MQANMLQMDWFIYNCNTNVVMTYMLHLSMHFPVMQNIITSPKVPQMTSCQGWGKMSFIGLEIEGYYFNIHIKNLEFSFIKIDRHFYDK